MRALGIGRAKRDKQSCRKYGRGYKKNLSALSLWAEDRRSVSRGGVRIQVELLRVA